ncbi:MAG: hypothetical protein ACXADC_14775, partial [Candidatus Thorarchaeota archaeon]
DCYRGLHLHTSPFEQLFSADWNLLEAHVDVYVEPEWLIEADKYIRAAVMRTDGPSFPGNADLKDAWSMIKTGEYNQFLQTPNEMSQRLEENIRLYGSDRVPFAGPECGVGPWDWEYGTEMALANLRTLRSVLSG